MYTLWAMLELVGLVQTASWCMIFLVRAPQECCVQAAVAVAGVIDPPTVIVFLRQFKSYLRMENKLQTNSPKQDFHRLVGVYVLKQSISKSLFIKCN